MVGALSVVGSPVTDSHSGPCLYLDALPLSTMSLKSGGDLVLWRNPKGRRQTSPMLSSSFLNSCQEDWRLSAKALSSTANRSLRKQSKLRSLAIVNELAGQYEDSFEDVKAVRIFSINCSITKRFHIYWCLYELYMAFNTSIITDAIDLVNWWFTYIELDGSSPSLIKTLVFWSLNSNYGVLINVHRTISVFSMYIYIYIHIRRILNEKG